MPTLLLIRSSDASNDDDACYIWTVAVLVFVITTLTLAMRIWIKWKKFSCDDAAIVIGSIMAYAQFGAVAAALTMGMGKKWRLIGDAQQSRIAENITAAKCLYILSLGFVKIGLIWPVRNIYLRLHMKWLVGVCNVLLACSAVWTLGSLIILVGGCSPGHILPKSDQTSCTYGASRWGFVLFFDGVTEIAFVALATYMLDGLKANMEEKVTLIIAFALRLGVIVFAILSYVAVRAAIEARTTSNTESLAYSYVQIWRDAEICYSMLTAALPFALRLVRNLDSIAISPPDMAGLAKLASRGRSISTSVARLRTVDGRAAPALRMPSMPNDVHIHGDPIKYAVEISAKENVCHGHNPAGEIRREDRVVVSSDLDMR